MEKACAASMLRLASISRVGKRKRFSYDANGKVVSVNYNGTEYYYVRNAQGDIVKLLDNNKNTVVEYIYDSWGKLISTTGSLASTLGQNQPFRYRSYVYDTETGLYYLRSRYYDPATCRFISSDVYLSTSQGVLGHNSYAYCGNNPINRADDEGDFWHIVIGAVVGAVIGAVQTAVTGGDITDVLIGAAAGAASGALAATGAGVVVQTVASAGISMVSNAAQQVNKIVKGKQDRFDVGDMLVDGAIGAVLGAAGGDGASYGNSKNIMQHGKELTKRISKKAVKKGFKNGFKDAVGYYAKVAHAQGGKFVLRNLAKSFAKTTSISTVIIVAKNAKKIARQVTTMLY